MEKVKERITHYSLYVTALLKWLGGGRPGAPPPL